MSAAHSASTPPSTSADGGDDAVEEADAEALLASLEQPHRFAEIFDRHWTPIHRYCAARLGVDRGEEVAAETFTIAFDHRGRFDPTRGTVRSWVFGIAANRVRREHRTTARARRAITRLTAQPSPAADDATVARVDAQARDDELAAALDGLRADERDVLLLAALTDLTYAEMADALGTPIGTVRSRLSRARTKAAGRLEMAS